MRYKVAEATHYKKYDDCTLVFQTENKKVMLLNGICGEILDCFCDYASIDDCRKILREKYSMPQAGETATIDFIKKVIDCGILQKENILCEEKYGAEGSFRQNFLPIGQLYAVQFELTFRCNESCRHCYCLPDKTKQELTLAEIKRVLDDLCEMNVFEVTFTGGDLFVRKDAFDILEYAREKGFLITVFTNGNLLSDSDIFRLKRLRLKSIHFSVYSHIAKRHDEFTGVSGSFEKTVDVIKKCVLINIPVNIKVSIMNYNIDDISGILALAKKLGTTVQVSMSISPKNDGNLEPVKLRLQTISDYVRVMREVDENIQIHCSAGTEHTRPESGAICGAGVSSLNINPYGEVFACNALLLPCGNVRERSIKEIWETSESLKEIRSFTLDKIGGCEKCPELKYCNFCPGSSLTETGNPLKRYSEACMLAEAKKLTILKKEVE